MNLWYTQWTYPKMHAGVHTKRVEWWKWKMDANPKSTQAESICNMIEGTLHTMPAPPRWGIFIWFANFIVCHLVTKELSCKRDMNDAVYLSERDIKGLCSITRRITRRINNGRRDHIFGFRWSCRDVIKNMRRFCLHLWAVSAVSVGSESTEHFWSLRANNHVPTQCQFIDDSVPKCFSLKNGSLFSISNRTWIACWPEELFGMNYDGCGEEMLVKGLKGANRILLFWCFTIISASILVLVVVIDLQWILSWSFSTKNGTKGSLFTMRQQKRSLQKYTRNRSTSLQ